ncbi:MAG: hypothetical protein WCS31_00520 [Verrucomicrobiae bacterium]
MKQPNLKNAEEARESREWTRMAKPRKYQVALAGEALHVSICRILFASIRVIRGQLPE